MYSNFILNTKLYKPVVKENYVLRKEIIESLEKNRQNPLTLVVAPTGYGKSVTISEWLDYTKVKYCWLSLDDELNDVKTFFLYLIYAVRSVFPNALSTLKDFLEGHEMPTIKTLINFLIDGIVEMDKELIIVLDDYQSINKRQIHEIVDSLLKNSCPKLHLVIISRKDPPLQLSQLQAFGNVNEIRMTNLSFTQEEILALAEKNLNIQMKKENTRLLLQKTEGWIIGLRMALMYIAGSKDIEKSINELKVDQHYYRQYLLDIVLKQQPEDIQKLLLTTSILDRFSWELLKAIIGKENKTKLTQDEVLFDQLISSTLFIIQLDTEGKWYRFHHLVRDLLQNQLTRLYSDKEIMKLYSNASDWFESHKLFDEAIQYAVKAKDFSRTIHIIEQNRLDKLMLEQWWVVKNWLQSIPENIQQEHTILLLTKLYVYQEEYRYEEFIHTIQLIEQRLSIKPNDKHLGELLTHKGYLNVWVYGNPKEAIKQLERSKSLFPDREEIGMRRENQLAVARQMTGHKKEALEALQKEIHNPKNSGYLKTSLASAVTLVHLLSGELKQAINSAQKYISLRKELEPVSKLFWDEFLLATALFQCYEVTKAERTMEKLLTYKDIVYPGVTMQVFAGYCFITALNGEVEVTEKYLKEFDSYARDTGYENFIWVAQSSRARIHLFQGKTELALEWSKSYLKEPSILEWHIHIEVPAITKARIWIASGSKQMVQDAVDDLNRLLDKVQSVHNQFQIVDVLVLLAIGYLQLGNNSSAKKSIKEAIIISEENGFIRPFIEPGRIVVKLFEELSINKDHGKFVNNLRMYWPPEYLESIRVNVSTPKLDEDLESTLSKREIEILQFVAAGLKNKEIAEKLYLAHDSVKKSLYRVYQKLGVNNRISAVSKAAEMGLVNHLNKMD